MSVDPQYQIMTNLNCNLDCTYCYEKKVGRQNTVENIRTFLNAMFERDKDRNGPVVIDIIGGEPMLYPDLAYAAMEIANELAAKNGRACVHGALSTNGTCFGDPGARKFIEDFRTQLMVGVSIDGIKEIHDKHRFYKTDATQGSYDKIVESLPWLLDTLGRRAVNVKHTMTEETSQAMAESYFNLVDLGFAKITQNLVFEGHYDADFGMRLFQQLRPIMDHWAGQGWYNSIEYLEITSKTMPDYLSYLAKPPKDERRNACGTCTHMHCLGFDGEVYGCNRFLTMNQPGKVIGSLDHDKQIIVPSDNGLLEEVKEQWKHKAEDPICGKCPLRNECSNCVASAYESPLGIEEHQKSRYMCGWTHAMSVAKIYAISLMEIYEAEHGEPPDRFAEAGLFMAHPGCGGVTHAENPGNKRKGGELKKTRIDHT